MNNNRFYKFGAGIGIALIALIISFIILAKNNDKKIAQLQNNSESLSSSTDSNNNALTIDTKSQEFEEIESNDNVNNSSKNNTTIQKKNNSSSEADTTSKGSKKTTTNSSTKSDEASKVTEKKEEPINKDPVFSYPVKGEVMTDYAKDKLIYSNTLGEWVTHRGIDIKASKTTVVSASSDGTVKSIKNDPRYGLTVVIEHSNGFSTVYANLLTAEFVSTGEKVKAGQTIGTVGNTASFEILDESHLHFEILKDGEQVDPNMYLKN